MFDHQKVHPYVITLGHCFPRSMLQAGSDLVPSSVWGPTCDSIDCVCPVAQLPRTLEVGDWLGFEEMGAYTICAASQFNGFRSSLVHYTSGTGTSGNAVRRALAAYSEFPST